MDKKETLKERGIAVFNKHVISAGILSARDVSELLNIPMSQVSERREKGLLLAVQIDQGTVFPGWQFDKGGVIDHFTEIMLMLATSSSVSVFRFFQTFDEDLGCTPTDALKNGDPSELEIVKILAKQFNNQVAR